ncbi:hypothetical protein QBC42DRAFT_349627 [Cladorrhinum samala]|uniref:Indole-diterpene biosynthesis protein PaxU n=1 Tax=Cladorrhinum samala TaxID=585594 RepID=A0AAV9HBK8_9PEZI|nr:hypothetical protein QBC42DRAFT_349627 [Cladorrhinum samala]
MSSSTPPTKSQKDPLSPLTKLSPCAYIYQPSSSSDKTTTATTINPTSTDPKLIILSTWMSAASPHIAKYLAPYQALYPSSPILLLRSWPRHFFIPHLAARELKPAVTYFLSVFPPAPAAASAPTSSAANSPPPPPPPELLVHTFSNGGSLLYALLRRAVLFPSSPASLSSSSSSSSRHHPTQPETETLLALNFPRYKIIFDSNPGQFRYRPAFKAFSASLGRGGLKYYLFAPLIHLTVVAFYVWHLVAASGKWLSGGSGGGGGGDAGGGPLRNLANSHNSLVVLNSGRELGRTYIYSKPDELVDWRDVEAHADDAERRGFKNVRREEFLGTGHVAHARGGIENQERYWGVVRSTWEGKVVD